MASTMAGSVVVVMAVLVIRTMAPHVVACPGSVGQRQPDAERGSLARGALHRDPAALPFHECSRDSKPETDPGHFGQARGAPTVKPLEEERDFIGKDARPGVGDRNNGVRSLGKHTHP